LSALEATSEAIVSEGVVSEDEVVAALAAIRDFIADPHTFICGLAFSSFGLRRRTYRSSTRR
jgi:hypothetical protein